MLFLLAAPLSHTVNEAVSDLSNPDVYNKDTGSSFSRAVEDTTGVKMSAIIYEEGGSLNESLAMMYDAQDQLTEAYKQAALPFVKAFAGDARAEQVSHQIDVLSERNREMTKPYVQQGKVGMEHSLDTLLHNLNAFTASLKAAMADPKTAYAEWKQSKTATEQPPAPAFLEVVSSADSAPAKAPEEKSAQANSNGAFFEHQWIPFMQTGVQSGAAFAAQGAATGSHFFSDPNFDLNKEGSEFQKTGVQTANAFGSLMQAKEDVPAARSADAISYNCMTRELWSKEKAAWCCEYKKLGCPETEAKAPAEKVGWMPFAQTGAETGASFAAQGANTAFRFFTDPNFDFQKEGEAYQASSAATADKFASIQFSENATVGDAASSAASFVAAKYAEHQAAEEAAKEAAAPPAEKVGWMPFAQTGAETGVNFAAQGANTAFRFFFDPNFDFQKEGEAYQASSAATADKFASIQFSENATVGDAASSAASFVAAKYAEHQAAEEAAKEAAAPPAEKVGWMPFAQTGAETGVNFAAQGADTAFRFFTDPNFDFQKEGEAYQASSAATADKFASIQFSENATVGDAASSAASFVAAKYAEHQAAEEAAKEAAAAPPAEKVGWMPFAQTGAGTGVNFAAQGADTAFRFFTDPNFDFQKEGEAYQASGKATQDQFAAIDGAAAPGALRADAVAGDAHNSSFVAHVGIISFLAVNVAVFVAHRMNLRRKERAVIRQLDELV